MPILISINPPHTTNIFAGIKQIEWRHGPLPAGGAYCYETKRGGGCGMVIGEFEVVDFKQFFSCDTIPLSVIKQGCVSVEELKKYTERNSNLTANYLQHAKLYRKPKPLSEFYRKCETMPCEGCGHLKWQRANPDEYEYECEYLGRLPIIRPPQSWCYAEEIIINNRR